ncbi:hypothetical protein QEN19_000853 [Hanseniaspora menglaensis]
MLINKSFSVTSTSNADDNYQQKEQSSNKEEIISSKKRKTLHKVTTKNFNRTPKGLFFSKDAKDIYCIVLLCLDLKDNFGCAKKHPWIFNNKETNDIKSENYYTFNVESCLNTMVHLNLNIDMNITTISISYSIKKEMSMQLINLFLNSKLLHLPNDRTSSKAKSNTLLQPTPKGVAILTKYVQDMGIKKIPEILYSNLNSSKLFNFERSLQTDKIVYNEYFIKIIFMQMLGDHPNIWSPTLKHDKIPALMELLEITDDENMFDDFEFSCTDSQNLFDYFNKKKLNNCEIESTIKSNLGENISSELLTDISRMSPLAHKFFTNPDSDAHVQYYTTNSGLRIWKNLEFYSQEKKKISFCFSTKAIVQWLMDCTDLIYYKEAVIVASLFYKKGLIVPITISPSLSVPDKFSLGKNNLYTFSKTACSWLNWSDETITQIYSSFLKNHELHKLDADSKENLKNHVIFKNITGENLVNQSSELSNLNTILKDPGRRFLFKNYLEKTLCSENFYAFIDIKNFLHQSKNLENLVQISSKNKELYRNVAKASTIYVTINDALQKETNESQSMLYHIFSTYIAQKAPKLVNIDYNLRTSISLLVFSLNSPYSANSNITINKMRSKFLPLNDPKCNDDLLKNENDQSNYKLKMIDSHGKQKSSIIDHSSTKILKRKERPENLNNLSNDLENIKTSSSNLLSGRILSSPLFKSETDFVINQAMFILKELKPLFKLVNECLYKMMETDALPKFLNNENK